jgi:hypothetical protein
MEGVDTKSERGRGRAPPPQQAGLKIPSFLNIHKKVAIASLGTL